MTVLIYVDTNKQVGEPEHIKVFANFCCLKEWEIGFRSPSPQARLEEGGPIPAAGTVFIRSWQFWLPPVSFRYEAIRLPELGIANG